MRRTVIVGFAFALVSCTAADTPPAAPERFSAIGQEPFFALQHNAEGFVLSQPDAADLKAPPVAAQPIDDGWAFETPVYGVTVRREPCVAPSGDTLPYTVEITLTQAGFTALEGAAAPAMTGCGSPE